MAIRWVFFDIGDVLFDEDAPHLFYYHSVLLAMRRHGVSVTWDAYRARIEAYARTKPATAIWDAGRDFVPDEALWRTVNQESRAEYQEARKPRPYGMLLNDILPVVRELHRSFKLGIIANQHPVVLQALDDYGLGPFFEQKIIDEIDGVAKPDPAIFQLALSRCGCSADKSIMIGDRIDNDVLPARSVGMTTLRFRRGILYGLYEPLREEERPDLEVHHTYEIVPAIHRLASLATTG